MSIEHAKSGPAEPEKPQENKAADKKETAEGNAEQGAQAVTKAQEAGNAEQKAASGTAEKKLEEDIKNGKNSPKKAAETREEAAEIKDKLKTEPEKNPEIPDEVKGMGFMAVLEKLFEKFSALLDKLTAQIDKMFKGGKKEKTDDKAKEKAPEAAEKAEAKFEKSLLGQEKNAEKKFALQKSYEAGKGVSIKAEKGDAVYAVQDGTLKKVSDNAIEITFTPDRKVVYSGVSLKNDITNGQIKAGAEIGKIAEAGNLQFQYFEGAEEKNPAPLLSNFITA